MSRNLLKTSAGPLQQQYRLALLDLDGVVYRGKNPVAHAAASITAAAKAGMTITYTTNNPSRTAQTIADQIAGFGIDVTPRQIITSALVAARLLRRRLPEGAKVYVCGGEPLKDEVRRHGLTVVDSADDAPDAVIAGWFPDMGWKYLAQACIAIEHGAQFYATNRDLTLPREKGLTPGIGAFVNAIITTTGVRPVASAGKPESAMYDEEREIYAEDGDDLVPVSQSLPVGDRLDTDIEAANRGGYDSLCVLTGVTDARQLLLATPILRPTYISADLRGLGTCHTAPAAAGEDAFALGGWTASYDRAAGRIDVRASDPARADADADAHGVSAVRADTTAVRTDMTDADSDGDATLLAGARTSVDALRAACQLCWTLADRGIDVSALDLPEFDL